MKIARVFPTKTSMAPTDPDAYFGEPDMFTPNYDEVYISVTFTWDINKAFSLACAWKKHTKVIKVDGVAISGESGLPFVPGVFLRKGITITSRGCPNNCNFCMVRRGLIEFDNFPEGNIVQDNNILACSDHHWRKVLAMLKEQRAIEFKGGLEKCRITPKIAEDLRGLRIKTLWLSCDQPEAIKPLERAVKILLNAGFTRNHLYCYVLVGDNRTENEDRLKEVFNLGCMPFAQLFRNENNDIEYSKDWKQFARKWSRPAIIRSILTPHRGGEDE